MAPIHEPSASAAATATAYDVVTYPGRSYVQTHPDRLATIATLFGLKPAPLERCRVLELGCGDSTNLLPVAFTLPGSHCVGIDLSAEAVARGQRLAAEIELNNLSLRRMDLIELPSDFGQFDYVIAHGLYSWVPPAVQERVLGICKAHLAPGGVAFVSYNALPGCRIRQMSREMMRYHVAGFRQPAEQVAQARALIKFLADARDEADSWGRVLRWELEHIGTTEAGPLYHDDLAEVNEALYFHEFADRVGRRGLQFVSEASFPDSQHVSADPGGAPAAGSKLAQAFSALTKGLPRDDVVAHEQYADFVRGRKFRQSLLCHAEETVRRPPAPRSVESLYAAAPIRPESAEPDVRSNRQEKFTSDKGASIVTNQPIAKAALMEMSRRWPRPVSFDDLLAGALARLGPEGGSAEGGRPVLASLLLSAYGYASNFLELRSHVPQFVAEVSERPTASRLARVEAKKGPLVTSMLGINVRLDAPLAQNLLVLLDGTRDREALVRELAASVTGGKAAIERDGRRITDPKEIADLLRGAVDARLQELARLALLVA